MEKKINLKKLAKLGILKLVDQSENLKESYLEKSETSLFSSKILLENNQFSDSIALSYFSMYNSLLALFYKCGIKCENHNASIFLLKEIFEVDNDSIKNAKIERKDKQYYSNFSVSKDEVLKAIKSAEDFNAILREFIERIKLKDISIYRNKLKDILK